MFLPFSQFVEYVIMCRYIDKVYKVYTSSESHRVMVAF